MHSLNSTKFKNGKTLVTFTRKSSMQRTPSFDEHKAKQECIPVGCVPPTVSHSICRERGGGGVYARHAPCHTHPSCHTCPLPCMSPAMYAPATYAHLPCMPPFHTRHPAMHLPAMHAPLPHTPPTTLLCTEFSTHTYENITLPQLRGGR